MDLSIPIVGLLGYLGYSLSKNGKSPRKVREVRNRISANETPTGKNIYSSTYSKEINNLEQAKSDVLYRASINPERTNIIPDIYNTQCQVGCDVSPGVDQKGRDMSRGTSAALTKDSILPTVDKLGPQVEAERQRQVLKGPMFKPITVQGETLGPYWETSGGTKSVIKEGFANLSELTGGPLDMRHNNMTPFFRGSLKQNMDPEKNTSLLALYTGVDPTYRHKKEVINDVNLQRQEVNGQPLFTDLIDRSRYVQSNLKTNLLPAPQIRVHAMPESDVRPAYKTSEELQVKPRKTYSGRVLPGAGEYQRGKVGEFRKYLPARYSENGIQRTFIKAYNNAPAAREMFTNGNCRTIEESPFNFGPGFDPSKIAMPFQYVRRSKLLPDDQPQVGVTVVKDDTNQTYLADPWRNLVHDTKHHNYLDRGGYVAHGQQRDDTNQDAFLPAINAQQGIRTLWDDEARTTIKEGNLFSYTGVAQADVDGPSDYSSAYNFTKERQYIDNPDYKGIAGMTSAGALNEEQFDNVEIYSKREQIDDLRNYMLDVQFGTGANNAQLPNGADTMNIYQRDDSVHKAKYEYGANVQRPNAEHAGIVGLGEQGVSSNKELAERNYRWADVDVSSQLKSNPYKKIMTDCANEQCDR
jgi:hypothetical protein